MSSVATEGTSGTRTGSSGGGVASGTAGLAAELAIGTRTLMYSFVSVAAVSPSCILSSTVAGSVSPLFVGKLVRKEMGLASGDDAGD